VARFFTGLIGGILLCARIDEHLAKAGGKTKGPLFAVQNIRQRPTRGLVGQGDLLAVIQTVGHGAVELHDHAQRDDRLFRRPRFVPADVVGIVGVPEMFVRPRNNFVEVRRALFVALDIDHSREVVARNSIVRRIRVWKCHRWPLPD
jgi:hypothetical protein